MKTITATLLAAAVALAANAAFGASEGDMAPNDKASNELYWQGQAALKKSDWSTALKRFRELEQQLREKEPKSADAALYWEAYALVQAKRTSEAKNVLDRLRREFPHSRWSKDADALVQQAAPAAAKAAPADIGNEELAEVALEGLMSAPAERAMPLLRKVLKGPYSVKLKKRALFVMSQLDDSHGLDDVVEAAKDASDPELREEAVRILGVSGADAAVERLRELYATSKDAREKRQILDAYLVADRKDLVLAAARGEADPAVRAHAIHTLGALDASAELEQLYHVTEDAPNRRAIIDALGVAGNSEALAAIAADAKQPEDIRIAALHALGVAGDRGGDSVLRRLYASADTPALRDAVLQGLLVADDSDGVLELYRNAKTVDEKKALLRTLTAMGDDTAIDAIESELDKAGKP
ncbi:MAG: HEAT repeat domain-containing protein [Dokdonella sp.]|uniref:HEAT repeat domain-containing protein n=1 Tax=Dokdonella sp. TaxID=2291710 RepID=UPI003F815CFB